MKKFYYLTLIAAGIVIFGSCCACRATKSPSLTDDTWQLVELNGEPITILPEGNREKYTMTFGTDGRIAGLAECNRYFGSYELGENDALKISGTGSTRMACLDDNFETEFLQILDKVANYRIDGRYLILTDDMDYVLGMFKKIE
ncbi:MAG: META domain-containing protein [Rikenellaceae bacterium]|nr:META domain-containing protein [Rikenellaceae bacterium]